MENLEKYLKYYFLEDYLFNEVHKNFQKHEYLTPEEFFAIIIWKSNRAKTNVRSGIKKSGKTIKSITSNIFQAKTFEQKLDILTSIPGLGLPIASAILTVCYPDDFTVVDYRAQVSLKKFGEAVEGNPAANTPAYLDYLDKCKKLSHRFNVSLRDFDRMLWAKDFYDGTKGLKEFTKDLN